MSFLEDKKKFDKQGFLPIPINRYQHGRLKNLAYEAGCNMNYILFVAIAFFVDFCSSKTRVVINDNPDVPIPVSGALGLVRFLTTTGRKLDKIEMVITTKPGHKDGSGETLYVRTNDGRKRKTKKRL